MGSDDLFKKRRAEHKHRNYEFRKTKVNSFLIVTEGEKTEPLYLRGIVYHARLYFTFDSCKNSVKYVAKKQRTF